MYLKNESYFTKYTLISNFPNISWYIMLIMEDLKYKVINLF